jgi:hypothetical protein
MSLRFVPDSGYSEWPQNGNNSAQLLDASQAPLPDSYTPLYPTSTWGVNSRSFSTISGAYLALILYSGDSWRGTVYIDNVSLTP